MIVAVEAVKNVDVTGFPDIFNTDADTTSSNAGLVFLPSLNLASAYVTIPTGESTVAYTDPIYEELVVPKVFDSFPVYFPFLSNAIANDKRGHYLFVIN